MCQLSRFLLSACSKMIIGTPTEVKHDEGRVGLTPAGVAELVQAGHTVLVQSNAGKKACFFNDEYVQKGATIVETAAEVYSRADMIVKVSVRATVMLQVFHCRADKYTVGASLETD